jgi:hypothetical protein
MPNAYLVMENEYMYNDEYNELLTSEGTCSNPKRIFWTREEAEAAALEIARQSILGEPLFIWGESHEYYSSLGEKDFYANLGALLGDEFNTPDFEEALPSSLDDSKFKQLLAICDKLQVAVIVETEITNESAFQEAAETLKNKEQIEQSKLEQVTQLFGLRYEPVESDLF